MDILPAIDLLAGKCVRLVQGHYDRVIEYERDPVEVANDFRQAGATWLHVVDLQGARCGELQNLDALKRLAATGARIEFGGGVRTEDAIRAALDAGAERVLIGTRALEDWAWFETVVHEPKFLNKVSLGLDARLGKLATHGWTIETERTAVELAEEVAAWPLATICYTDIGRDGMLLGPNIEAIRALASVSGVPVVAAGGVTDLEDVRRLAQLNLEGVVIGRAFYEKTLELKDVLEVAYAGDEGR
ncbi:MAG: 1-(5-phosphoribosyl)-5-[(5-phosphoribosylamino)methylideneamino]imidazole-4-carboxamide isomerase [Planctomycetes bacterium]|nr:1-(5-phosphoribosyl)-5-[(5-phosphoribosylamino)methylideneamino]imidazole-4-carboxamide isomerase [Planctomycetota bacterium]